METDKNSCWYQQTCIDEMNRFYDVHKDNQDVLKHFSVFSELLSLTNEKYISLLDVGCGTAMLSKYCKDYFYAGADLPHILKGCAMRNYPDICYHNCDMIEDDLFWIHSFKIIVMNGVLDIMQHPLEMLDKILESSCRHVIIHRQEITEEGNTVSHQNGSYGGYTYHSIINRNDFNKIIDKNSFEIIKEIRLDFANWENGGSSFLLRKKV